MANIKNGVNVIQLPDREGDLMRQMIQLILMLGMLTMKLKHSDTVAKSVMVDAKKARMFEKARKI